MRVHLQLTVVLLLLSGLLAGCTRDRPEPPPAATFSSATLPAPAEPQVTESAAAAPAAVAAEPTATPAPETETIAYTVQSGDSLSIIAEKFNTTTDAVRQLNFLTDNNILVGEILRIPLGPGATAAGVPTATPEPYTYVVQPGDTLYSIAFKFDVSATEMVAANTLVDPNNLRVGARLLIPGYQAAPAAAAPAARSGASSDSGRTGSSQVTHVVQSGQGLLQIARDYGVEMSAIVAANNISNPNLIKPGQELIIPGTTVSSLSPSRRVHVVQTGQSLSVIAVQYGVALNDLVEANGITDANSIYVGQQLVIPDN